MRHRSTVVLFALFLAGLGILWWADYAKVRTRKEQQELLNRLIPELVDTPLNEVRRIEVDPGPGAPEGVKPIVVERREGGSWQMTRPTDAAADANLVETLARNLKELRKSADAGTIHGDPTPYGLDKPTATVKIFGTPAKGESAGRPLATLDVGKKDGKRLYVRPGGDSGIEVVDAVLLEALTAPPTRWRDTALFHIPSFRVGEVAVREPNAGREIDLRRDERHWRIAKPIQAPADNDKAEGLVAELSALHVADGFDGFVKDDVRGEGLAAFGLDKPSMTVTVTPLQGGGSPQTLTLGGPVPGKENQVYAMRADQDDVVRLDVKRLREALPGVNGLRSQTVLDMAPQRVSRLQIDARGTRFDLARTTKGWRLLSPVAEKADAPAVDHLLKRLSDLKTSEFLDPKRVTEPRLDPPAFRIRGWQAEPGAPPASESPSAEPQGEPRFDLALGRVDVLRKTVYGRVAGDETVLAVPDAIVADLPANNFAYRDQTVLALNPQDFAKLTVERGATGVTVEPAGTKGPANEWVMVAPVRAKADTRAVTALLMALAGLRAESWESDHVGDGKAFGLDTPAYRVKWALVANPGEEKVLRVGKPKPDSGSIYANVEGDERVFALNPTAMIPFEAELHDKTVLSFKAENAERIVLRWPSRTVTLNKYPRPGASTPEWQPAIGFDTPGVDLARVGALVAAMGSMKTPKFLQYDGPLPATAGLDSPTLSVRVKIAGEPEERTLRIGQHLSGETYAATTAAGDSGPVFILPVVAPWKDLMNAPSQPGDLPADVFTPALPVGLAK